MRAALIAWLDRVARGADPVAAAMAAAEAEAADPWAVVAHAGLLARCAVGVASADLGLDAALRPVSPGAPRAIVRVERGAPIPVPRNEGRSGLGAFDTPRALARDLARRTVGAASRPVREGLDPACGSGAFLVALGELGLARVRGGDLDPAVLAVARIAAPRAVIELADGLLPGDPADVVVGNPPYVPPERQDKALRERLRREMPWLTGRFDLAVPFAARATERVAPGGALGLLITSAVMSQRYGAPLRRRWLQRSRVVHLSAPRPFPGAAVEVSEIVLRPGEPPGPVGEGGPEAAELLALDNAPLDPSLRPGDAALVAKIRAASAPLGRTCEVDTGVVAHSAAGGRSLLLFDAPGPRRVRYADAADFFAGRTRWLDYDPARMHRAKRPDLFERPKIVVQRVRGRRPVRAAIDRDGIYVGHTCTVIRPFDEAVAIERLLDLVRSPLVDGVVRVEAGHRLDLYPRDVAAIPVPRRWRDEPGLDLATAWGLTSAEVARLLELATR